MDGSPVGLAVGLLYLAILAGLTWRLIRRRKRYGPALTGTAHDLLNEDRRHAVELITTLTCVVPPIWPVVRRRPSASSSRTPARG